MGCVVSRAASVWLRVAFQLGQVPISDSEIEPHPIKQPCSSSQDYLVLPEQLAGTDRKVQMTVTKRELLSEKSFGDQVGLAMSSYSASRG